MTSDWRVIERCIIDYLHSLHVHLSDGGGAARVETVLGIDETKWVSIEDLARHLAEEIPERVSDRAHSRHQKDDET
jgi:hypothetical protein